MREAKGEVQFSWLEVVAKELELAQTDGIAQVVSFLFIFCCVKHPRCCAHFPLSLFFLKAEYILHLLRFFAERRLTFFFNFCLSERNIKPPLRTHNGHLFSKQYISVRVHFQILSVFFLQVKLVLNFRITTYTKYVKFHNEQRHVFF